MPESFSTHVIGFDTNPYSPVRAFVGNDGEIGNNKEHFNTPAASPVVGFNINPYSPVRGFA